MAETQQQDTSPQSPSTATTTTISAAPSTSSSSTRKISERELLGALDNSNSAELEIAAAFERVRVAASRSMQEHHIAWEQYCALAQKHVGVQFETLKVFETADEPLCKSHQFRVLSGFPSRPLFANDLEEAPHDKELRSVVLRLEGRTQRRLVREGLETDPTLGWAWVLLSHFALMDGTPVTLLMRNGERREFPDARSLLLEAVGCGGEHRGWALDRLADTMNEMSRTDKIVVVNGTPPVTRAQILAMAIAEGYYYAWHACNMCLREGERIQVCGKLHEKVNGALVPVGTV